MNSDMSKWATPQKMDWFKQKFRPHFDEWVEAPVQRLIDIPEAMPAFVWLTCSIDWLAGFWHGKPTDRRNKKIYVGFIKEYFLPNYDPLNLYDSLRNGLVHLYTIKNKKYLLTHQEPSLHFSYKDGQQILNLENFFEDWKNAKNKYFNDVENDSILLDKLIERYIRDGFLGHVSIP